MKWAYHILLLCFLITPVFGQSDNNDFAMAVNSGVANAWITQVKKADRNMQIKLIKERFFSEITHKLSKTDSVKPLLIINGINISPAVDMDANQRKEFLDYFHSDYIESIIILDDNPERLHRSNNINGIILITFNEKKVDKIVRKF